MRVSITGGWVIDPANGIDEALDVHLADGLVAAVGPPPEGFVPDRTYPVGGDVVCPGLVELGASLREPGQERKATIASETRAAARGGITTLCATPDTEPVVDSPAVLELVHQRAAEAGHARVEVLGALTCRLEGTRLAEMGALYQAGCIGVGNGYHPVERTDIMRRAMEYASTFGLPVFLRPEDPWLAAEPGAHEGVVGARLGLAGIPASAETVALARDLLLVEATGVRAHVSNLSTARGVQMVADAQARGLPVTADVTAHHLHLTEMDVADFNTLCHVRPPLRTQRDRDALREGLRRGVVGAVSSAHQPHEPDAKLAPFPESEPGVSGLETLLPLTLRLVEDGLLGLPEAIALLTIQPARVLAIDGGTLSPGRPADLCVFDPEARWVLTPEALWSAGHNTPFLGWELKGRVTHTFLEGELVYRLED